LLATCSPVSATEADTDIQTQEGEFETSSLAVPLGAAPDLDGDLSPGEWDQALELEMSRDGAVYFQHDGEYLYVGIAAEGLGYGSLCWERDDQVWILHSSAALGSAAYQADDTSWRPLWDYEWCCRSAVPTSERQVLFEQEGWMASISYMGDPGQMEYQIDWEEEIQLAVIYQTSQELDTAFLWPQSLSDACVDLVLGSGELMDPAIFIIDSWETLVPAAD
jgi:hypothetical protein